MAVAVQYIIFNMNVVASITTSANWTSSLQNQTLTVPSGNPGTIKFTVTAFDFQPQYSKNNAAFVNFNDGDTLSVANNDTLKFRTNPAGSMTGSVIDNTTGATVGTINF